jgi:hypothetical protein
MLSWRIPVARQVHYCGSDVDPPDHRTEHAGPDPQQFYPGKASDHSLAQRIKEAYDEVEKGKRGYKVASIQDGTVHLACQLIAGKLIRKNHPMQVTRFMVDLAGKCMEGMQMNWVSYLINELEKDCREAQDQGYEFHFSWLLVLITFVAWKMPEGASLPRDRTIRAIGREVLDPMVHE